MTFEKLFELKPLKLAELLLQSTARNIVNQGGTASGKTWSILQVLFLKSLLDPGQVTTIVAETIPNLKRGALRDAIHIINQNPKLKAYVNDYNRTDRVITFKNGSIIEFNSYFDEQDAKSGKRDYLFVNEANGVPWEIYWQLSIRTRKQRFTDYNPTTAFWAHDKLLGQPDTEYFRTYHKSNTYLTAQQHAEIEEIKDPDYWSVYARGLTGNIRGIIYPNWKQIDQWPENIEEVVWGIDFGYTNDPTAIVKVGFERPRTVYLHECAYKPGLSPEEIKEILLFHGHIPGETIWCDHDKEIISVLRRLGLAANMAFKGENSVKNGILKLQSLEVHYTTTSENIHFERNRYKWKQVDGLILNKPDESTPDHVMDSARYAIYSHLSRG
jgi:phage terminase large subunit